MWRKRVLQALTAMLALVLLTLIAWVAVAGPTTVGRILRYGDTDIDDFSHYPGRQLEPSLDPLALKVQHEPIEPADGSLVWLEEGAAMDELLAGNDTIAFLVIKDGTIRHESYYQGHTSSSLSQLFSVSKSVTSLLVGIALDENALGSVDDPVTNYIPELAANGFDSVSLRHLLTMTSGSDYVENDNPFGEHVILNYTPRLENRLLTIGIETKPGQVFRYKSGDNALAGLALSRALGEQTITEFAQEHLWQTVGLAGRGVWTVDSEQDGLEKTWCCLAMTAPDLARIGQLFLDEGQVEGAEIVPSEWIRSSTSPQVPPEIWPEEYSQAGWRNYGYQWWLTSEEEGDFFALGKDGQYLYVNPTHKVVIVRLGWSNGDLYSSQWINLFQSIASNTD